MIFEAEVPLPNGSPYTRFTSDIRWNAGGPLSTRPQIHFYPYEQSDMPEELEWSEDASALPYLRLSHPDLVSQIGEDNFRQALYTDPSSGSLTFVLTPRSQFEVGQETEKRTYFIGQFNTDILLKNRQAFLREAIGIPDESTSFNCDDIRFDQVIMRRFYNFYGMAKPDRVMAFAHPNTNGEYPNGNVCWGSNQLPQGTARERAETAFGILTNNTCMASPLNAYEGLPYWRRPVRIQLHGVDQHNNPHALEIDMKLVQPEHLSQFDRELRDHAAAAQNINDGRVENTYYYGDGRRDYSALRGRRASGRSTAYKQGIVNFIQEIIDRPEAATIISEVAWEISKYVWSGGLESLLPYSLNTRVQEIINTQP